MQLPKHAVERCLAALIRTGYNKHPLRAAQEEIIAHDGGLFPYEFAGKRQIERFPNADFLTGVGNLRVAEVQAGAPE